MEENYCVLCQDAHKMSQQCVADNVQCKGCGKKGHVRKDCSEQESSAQPEPNSSNSTDLSEQRIAFCKDIPGQGEANSKAKTAKTNIKRRTFNFTENQKNQIIHECVEEKISPTILAKKWKCSPYMIRTLIHKVGKQLPKKYNKRATRQPESQTSDSDEDTANDIDNGIASRLIQRKGISQETTPTNETLKLPNQDSTCSAGTEGIVSQENKRKSCSQDSNCSSKSVKVMSETDNSEWAELSQPPQETSLLLESSKIVDYSDSSAEECVSIHSGDDDINANVIFISDDEEINHDNTNASYKESMQIEMMEVDQDSLGPRLECKITSGYESEVKSSDLEPNNQKKKSPDLMAGKYHIVCVHLELFRSNKSSSTKLTQIGCIVSGASPALFFKAIKPCGIEEYLDHYKLGGDLMQALHMTKEDDGTWLFRSRFEVIEEAGKIVCNEESEAIASLLDFIQNYPNCIIVGVDEETVAILVKKLKYFCGDNIRIISGFTYWKRVLKYLDVDEYKNIDLEEYYTSLVGEDLPSFNTALDIATVVMKSVKDVTSKKKGGKNSLDADFYKLCKRIECIEHPQKVDFDDAAIVDTVEVYSSFRPSVSATISAEKLKEIILSSESDFEPEETERCQEGLEEDESEAASSTNFNNEATDNMVLTAGPVNVGRISLISTATLIEGVSKSTAHSSNVQQSLVQPTQIQPLPVQPSANQPTRVQVTTVKPFAVKATAVQLSNVQPRRVQATRVQSLTVQPAVAVESSAVQPTRVHPLTVQPSTAKPSTVQPSTAKPSTAQPSTVPPSTVPPSTVPPSTVQPSTFQPSTVQPLSTNPGTWLIGKPTSKGEGTVICPYSKCKGKVRYTRILKHMIKVKTHQSLLLVCLLCPICQVSVSPSEVRKHMPECCSDARVQPTFLDSMFRKTLCNRMAASQIASAFTLPGLSVLEDIAVHSPAFAAQRIILDSYLVTNFVSDGPVRLINCLWMYKNYQKTIKSQGHREVLSPIMFGAAVNELARVHWNIDVMPVQERSPSKILDFCQVYFKGFRKIGTD